MRTMFVWKVAMTTFEKIGVLYEVLKVSEIPLDYSSIAQLVEHAAVNRAVVGSSPTRGVFFDCRSVFVKLPGSMVKRLRHRPFTAVTRVRFPSESLKILYGDIAKR